MAVILVGLSFIFIFVLTVAALIYTRPAKRGCPKCKRRSGLTYANQHLWSWWLTQFHHAYHRRECQYCGWRGSLR